MSKWHKSMQRSVMYDLQQLTQEELENLYSIEIDENGAVWDSCFGEAFDSLTEWALFMEESEEPEEVFVKIGKTRHTEEF